jgi:flavin-dependent dehydrogenase
MRDTLIIGGGLAGAAAACHLAAAGRDVLLLERSTGPHDKVCGEFLSFEAQDELKGLQVDLMALGAVPIHEVAVQRGLSRASAPLPFRGLSLSRRILDEALLARAAELGVEIRRGIRVGQLAPSGSGWLVGDDKAGRSAARHVILATGKHELRGWRRPSGWQNDLLGLKVYLPLRNSSKLDTKVELHLFPGGYAGLQKVEGDRANLCLVVRREAFSQMGGRWEAFVSRLCDASPRLAALFGEEQLSTVRPLAIHGIPYGLVQARSEGLWRIGDQAAVIPSFTGEGMSIALHSARLASLHLLAGRSPDEFQRRLADDLRWQVRRSTMVSIGLVASPLQALASHLLHPILLRGMVQATRISRSARGRAA